MSSHLDYEINKELGECYLFMGDMDKAEEFYLKAASSNGVHPDPYLGLATIAVQRGDLNKAHTLYTQAADIQSSDKALAGMALVEMEMGAQDLAYAHFNEAMLVNPENKIAIFGLIQMGHALERVDELVPNLERVLEAAPGMDDVRFALAACLVRMERTEDAAHQLETVLGNDPNNEVALELYSQVMA